LTFNDALALLTVGGIAALVTLIIAIIIWMR